MGDAGIWVTVMTGLVGATASAYVLVMQARAKVRSDAHDRQVTEHEKLLDRQEKQLARDERVIQEQQEAIDNLYRAHARCREETAEIYGWLRVMREGWVRCAAELAHVTGNKMTEVPELPERRPDVLTTAQSEFVQRSTAQNAELAQKLNKSSGGDPPN